MSSLPYLSDHLTTLLIMIIVGSIILFPSAYFADKKGLFVAVFLLTAISAYLFMYGIALGKSFANSNSPTTVNWDHIIGFISFACLYSFIAYGAFIITQTIKTEASYANHIIIWLILCLGTPISMYAKQYIDLYQIQNKYYKTKIYLAHPKDFPILIDQLSFITTKTKASLTISSPFYSKDRYVRDFEGISSDLDEGKHSLQSHIYYTVISDTLIPIEFDAFELSWYSIVEKRFYKDTFPLAKSKLDIREQYEGGKAVNDMLFNILPDGRVDFLKRKYSEVIHTIPYSEVAYTEIESDDFTDIFTHFTMQDLSEHHLNRLNGLYNEGNNNINKHRESDSENNKGIKAKVDKFLKMRIVPPYAIDIKFNQNQSGFTLNKDIRVIDFYLNKYARSATFLKEIHKKPLPSHLYIRFIDQNEQWHSVNIAFNKVALFETFEQVKELSESDIYLDIDLDIENPEDTEISFKSTQLSVAIIDWKVTD